MIHTLEVVRVMPVTEVLGYATDTAWSAGRKTGNWPNVSSGGRRITKQQLAGRQERLLKLIGTAKQWRAEGERVRHRCCLPGIHAPLLTDSEHGVLDQAPRDRNCTGRVSN